MRSRIAPICIITLFCALIAAPSASSQIDTVRAAIARQDNLAALRILAGISDEADTPDTYLYRGIAYANLHEFKRALDTFREGAARYPTDPRFHKEALAFYRRESEIVRAKAQLRSILLANPDDIYASALLSSLDLSDGSIDLALRALNKEGRPRTARILDNYSLTLRPVISSALAFHNGEILDQRGWKTTAERLQSTNAFSSVALELEPANEANQYNAIVRTTKKRNTIPGFLVGALEGLPIRTAYVDIWNIGGSLAQFNSSYRWSSSRKRAEAQLAFPLPLPRLLVFELGTVWRSEVWEAPLQGQFRYRATAFRMSVKHINDRRIEIGAGLEYQKRAPVPNAGKLLMHVQYRPTNGRVKSQIRVDGFVARTSVLGDLNDSGVTLAVANRLVLSQDHGAFVDISAQGGALRGRVPVEDYFILGIDNEAPYPLRGHDAAVGGIYGKSPMGTDFVLLNSDVERRIGTMPFLRSPIQGLLFADLAKVFDRNRIYSQAGWLLDVGLGAKLEFQNTEFVVLYGRSVADGTRVLSASIQRRFW